MRYRRDPSWRWIGQDLLAGSPLRLFRLTPAGRTVADRAATGGDVPDNSLVDRLVDAGALHPAPGGARRFDDADVTIVTPMLGGEVPSGRVVVDDGSQPPLAGATIRLPDNRGPGAARNAARDIVGTELIAFVDADVDLMDGIGPSWLHPLLGHFDDDRVGLVAPRIMGERDSPLDLGAVPARIRPQTRVSYVPAAAIVVRATAFAAIGGFDETLRIGEDVDLVWRLDAAGWVCRYEPAAVVWHEPRDSLRARMLQQFRYGTSAADLHRRHPGWLAPWHAERSAAAGWFALLAGWWVAAAALIAINLVGVCRRLGPAPTASTARLAHVASAARFAIVANLQIGRRLADALRREWAPPMLLAAIVSRRARIALAVAWAIAPHRVLTDAAYGAGVWRGVIRRRTVGPVLPVIRRWRPSGRSGR